MDGKTVVGASSPPNPALHIPDPLSMTSDNISSIFFVWWKPHPRYYGKHRNPDIDFHTWERLLYIWFQISCWQATSKLITCHHISQVDPFLNDDWGNQFHTINDMISGIQWRINSSFNAITENSRFFNPLWLSHIYLLFLLFRLYLPTVKFQMIRP